MTTVTQRDMHIRWAAHHLQVTVKSTGQHQHIILDGGSDIPRLRVDGNTIKDAVKWIEDNSPTLLLPATALCVPVGNDRTLIHLWAKEWDIYKEVTSQVNLPTLPTPNWGRKLTYTLPVYALDEYGMDMFVRVETGYSDNTGLYCKASLYLSITDDENDEVVAKTLLSHYTLQLPVDIKTVKEAIQPGIRNLGDAIFSLSL